MSDSGAIECWAVMGFDGMCWDAMGGGVRCDEAGSLMGCEDAL